MVFAFLFDLSMDYEVFILTWPGFVCRPGRQGCDNPV